MNHAARFFLLIALGSCGDDGSNSIFSSGIEDRDKTADTLGDDEKETFCSDVESHLKVTVGLEEVMRVACAPLALLTSTSREACEELLDECARDAPKITLAREQREQECFDSLAACEADVSTLEGCVDVNVRALRSVLERVSCARFGDSSVQDDIDEARTAAACAKASNSCRDAVLLY
jgi:hypothetical protein